MIKETVLILAAILLSYVGTFAQDTDPIVISTNNIALVFKVEDRHLYQAYLGEKLEDAKDYAGLTIDKSAPVYSTSGMTNRFNVALSVTHADGNPSLNLEYISHKTEAVSDDIQLTQVILSDPKYPFSVRLFYKAFFDEDVIKTWCVISHQEEAPVVLHEFASASLYMNAYHYWLTQFHGAWGKEMQLQESKLTSGIKIIDSKQVTRATQYQNPSFMISLNKPSGERTGEVLGGTLAWSGNFKLAFQVDNNSKLHIISGINSFASDYRLKPGTDFETPSFIFSFSTKGKGQISRNIARWARRFGIWDGDKSRLTLLNHWQMTHFDYDEKKIMGFLKEAEALGVDMFLMDDGWFGNKYPRINAQAGLGDWYVNKKRFPCGLGNLIEQASNNGIKFGLWVEPEMVNPKSRLYHQHPEWILRLPNRPESYHRHQLVLDLSNPEVQDFVFDVIDRLKTTYPGIAYFKWDCNSPFKNAYSPYLGRNQSALYVDYVKGLYKVLKRIRGKYPHLPMMLCSGGGGRVDYGALEYFTEFWPSDNTNPMDRIFIQWGYSYFFPAIATCNHVSDAGNYSLKFRLDVAMMGKLGFSIATNKMDSAQISFIRRAIKDYNNIIKDVVWYGDLYRLISPYKTNEAALMYVSEDKDRAVVFTYSLYDVVAPKSLPIRLNGLDPEQHYIVKEINLPEGRKSRCRESGNIYTGSYLMNVGIHAPIGRTGQSAILQLTVP